MKGERTARGSKQLAGAVAILHVGGMDDDAQQQAACIDEDVALAPRDLLARIEALRVERSPPFLRSLGALAVDHRRRWARLAPFPVAYRHIERVVDALERAVPVPQHEVVMCRRLRRQVLGQRRPLAARPKNIEDPALSTSRTFTSRGRPPRRRDHWLDQRPLRIRQIARVTQAAPCGGLPVFRRPHRAPLQNVSGARQ